MTESRWKLSVAQLKELLLVSNVETAPPVIDEISVSEELSDEASKSTNGDRNTALVKNSGDDQAQ
jgi:hypothetical protein